KASGRPDPARRAILFLAQGGSPGNRPPDNQSPGGTTPVTHAFVLPRPFHTKLSSDIGPAPRKINAKAKVAKTNGNSYPPSPRSPCFQCTLVMATNISIKIENAASRVNNPTITNMPPKNS